MEHNVSLGRSNENLVQFIKLEKIGRTNDMGVTAIQAPNQTSKHNYK